MELKYRHGADYNLTNLQSYCIRATTGEIQFKIQFTLY